MTRIAPALTVLAALLSTPALAESQAVRAQLSAEVFRDCDPDGRGVVTREELVRCMARDDIEAARRSIAEADETVRVAGSLVAQAGGSARRQSLIEMLEGSGVSASLLDRIPSREGDAVTQADLSAARDAAMADLRATLVPRMAAAGEEAEGVLETLGGARDGRVTRRPARAPAPR